jgi:hypothetical protein
VRAARGTRAAGEVVAGVFAEQRRRSPSGGCVSRARLRAHRPGVALVLSPSSHRRVLRSDSRSRPRPRARLPPRLQRQSQDAGRASAARTRSVSPTAGQAPQAAAASRGRQAVRAPVPPVPDRRALVPGSTARPGERTWAIGCGRGAPLAPRQLRAAPLRARLLQLLDELEIAACRRLRAAERVAPGPDQSHVRRPVREPGRRSLA